MSRRTASQGSTRRDAGVSIHEVVVTTLLLTILVSAGGASFDTWMRTSQSNQERTMALQEGRAIGDRLSKEIRMATGKTETRYMASTPDTCTTNPLGSYSNTYTLTEAGPNSIAFYKVPSEGRVVRVRFSRDSTNQMWMATRDFSAPNEDQREEITNAAGAANNRVVVNGAHGTEQAIFRYLSDTTSPLTPSEPGGYLGCQQLTQVSIVSVVLYVDRDPNLAIGASTIETSIFIRSAGFWK